MFVERLKWIFVSKRQITFKTLRNKNRKKRREF